jgi:hypothetical protein
MLLASQKIGIRLKLDTFQWGRLTLPLNSLALGWPARPPCQNDLLHLPDPSPMREPLFTDDAQLATTDG